MIAKPVLIALLPASAPVLWLLRPPDRLAGLASAAFLGAHLWRRRHRDPI